MASPTARVAITMGDAAGVGPELALRVCERPEIRALAKPLLLGDAAVYFRVAKRLGLPMPPVVSLKHWQAIVDIPPGDQPLVIDCGNLDASAVVPGRFSATTGRASYETFVVAIDEAIARRFDAIVTGPIQKEAWYDAGIAYPGHTECLADRVAQRLGLPPINVRMMLTSPEVSCVLETIHVPLADVPGLLSVESLVQTIELAGHAIAKSLQSRGDHLPPRIAVLGLNPHAGENGLFSHGEEDGVVIPAIEKSRSLGWDVTGPLPPDTAFTPAMRRRFDVYVCLYHDQGLIPLKALAFDDAVNVTLGLPIVRTSVDHGTAMDLAWKGTANVSSMIAAIAMAAGLADS